MTNMYTTPIQGQYKSKIEGIIKIKYNEFIRLNVCRIKYELFYDGTYQYVFEPYYDILDALPVSLSQGIPGINLEKRQKFYYRVNMIPAFISERALDPNRENIKEELDKVRMDEYNPLEWLIRTETEYSGDNLVVERYRLPKILETIKYNDLLYGDCLNNLKDLSKETKEHIKQLLSLVGSGVDINTDNLKINNLNRTSILQLLIHEYELFNSNIKAKETNENDKIKDPHKGRKKSQIDNFVMEELVKELELKIIDEYEAMEILNIQTRQTLRRKIREYKLQKRK